MPYQGPEDPSETEEIEKEKLKKLHEKVPKSRRKPHAMSMSSSKPSEGFVLIVDDEPDVRKVLRKTLEKYGYKVLEAEDGEKAIEEINKGEDPLLLDVIIADIRMPKMSGIEVVNYYRKEWPSVPLIVSTGFPDVELATNMAKLGVVDYLVKPVEAGKLKEAVSKAMKTREINRL